MKKTLFFLFIFTAAAAVWFFLTKQAPQQVQTPEATNGVAQPLLQQQKTNPVEVASNTSSVQAAPQRTNTIEASESINHPISALTATNLEQWKTAIKGLKKLGGFTMSEHWLVEQPGRKIGLPIILSQGDKTVKYSAILISVSAPNGGGNVTEIQMQTPNMNIDETRELGLQLCNMLGFDSTEFLTWCSKVGNHWLDAPLYASRDFRDPNNNKILGFKILMTYDNEKPWMINFVIQ